MNRFVGCILSLVLLLSTTQALAGDTCWDGQRGNGTVLFPTVMHKYTKARFKTQDRGTWLDWAWVGPWTYCNKNGGTCKFRWDQGASVTVEISIGIKAELGPIELTPSFKVATTETESFGFDQEYKPGQRARPVMGPIRRWKSGVFVDVCYMIEPRVACKRNGNNAFWYRCDPNKEEGYFSGNYREDHFRIYDIQNF